jgi:hypothetical protein
MATTMERTTGTREAGRSSGGGWWAPLAALVALAVAIAAVISAVTEDETMVVLGVLAAAWGAAALVLARREPSRPLALIAAAGAAAGALAILVESIRPLAVAMVPAAGMHLLAAMPDGRLGKPSRRILVLTGYAVAAGAGAVLTLGSADVGAAWPAAGGVAAALLGGAAFATRYGQLAPPEQRRMKWLAWGVTVAAGGAVAVSLLRLLV